MIVECQCGRPTSGNVLCQRCDTTLAYAIANIAAYWADDHATTRTHIGGGYPAKHVDGRIVGGVVTMTATQIRWDTWATITAWCRILMDEQPEVDGPTCGEPCLHTSCAIVRRRAWPRDDGSGHIGAMCRYLERNRHWILGRDWAEAMLDELCNVEGRMRRLVDIAPPQWYAGKCECGRELYATTSDGAVHCDSCGQSWDIATRRERLLTEAVDHLVTATEAAAALAAWTDYDGTPDRIIKRISEWHGPRLSDHGTTTVSGRARPLYRLGDVWDLLVEQMRRDTEREADRERRRARASLRVRSSA